ncbi:MFS transporter [Cupriavidus necator]|uniref:General substrate transporter:Major facilitator superfamily MFS_1 n=1 Tax=Cupriavidus pinatubonensis (strain JMP 134 / LMG 1197) TaxID=264198 RepID=Q46P74_CUPPJ|nr:MFS transporter [Cupriavidus necator]
MSHIDGTKSFSDSNSRSSHLLARFDRLPTMSTHYAWAALLAINLMLEYYDNAIFSYAAPTIKAHTGMSTEQIGVISSALYVGMVIGALAGGWLSDRVGRRPVLVWGTVMYSLGVIVTAFVPGYEMILTSRFVTGLGVQAATSVLLVYVAEMFPRHARGRFLSLVTMGYTASAVIAAALAMFYLPTGGPNTWRYLFLAGGIGLLIAPLVYFYLPESVRWCVSRGKLEHAAQIVASLEARALRKGPLDDPNPLAAQGGAANATLRDLLRNKGVLRNLIVLFVSYFGVYLAYYTWINWSIYALVYGLKYPQKDAYFIMFIWVVVYGVMPFIAMRLLDRWERKNTILCMSVFCALALVVLGLSTSYWAVAVIGGALAIFSGFVLNAYYTYIPETMPTQLRALGNGIVMSGARVGGVVSGVMGAALVTAGGLKYVTWTAAAIYIAFAIPVLIFGPRTTNRSLEAVADEELGLGTSCDPTKSAAHAAA